MVAGICYSPPWDEFSGVKSRVRLVTLSSTIGVPTVMLCSLSTGVPSGPTHTRVGSAFRSTFIDIVTVQTNPKSWPSVGYAVVLFTSTVAHPSEGKKQLVDKGTHSFLFLTDSLSRVGVATGKEVGGMPRLLPRRNCMDHSLYSFCVAYNMVHKNGRYCITVVYSNSSIAITCWMLYYLL